MSKDPAVLFYTSDFLTATTLFTDEQIGQYIKLLCQQHQLGHLPEKHMINICKSYDSPVFSKFVKDADGLFYNVRMETEQLRRSNYSNSRRLNRVSKDKDQKDMSNHMSIHMETETETGTGTKDKTKVKPVSIEIPPHLADVWAGFVELRNKLRKPLTGRAISNILKTLSEYPQDIQIKMVDQSITCGYLGIFKLKTDFNQSKPQSKFTESGGIRPEDPGKYDNLPGVKS